MGTSGILSDTDWPAFPPREGEIDNLSANPMKWELAGIAHDFQGYIIQDGRPNYPDPMRVRVEPDKEDS